METIKSYEAALEELKQITRELEAEEVSVDLLALKVQRAQELVNWCRARLRIAEGELDQLADPGKDTQKP